MYLVIVSIAALIIAGLAFYAGKLLFLLSKQNERQKQTRLKRVNNMVESIETIVKAMTQQQCELSEGVIRVCNLLEALPLESQPDYSVKFPSIFTLFNAISQFDTLEARQALDKQTRRAQDKQRHEVESQYESSVLDELPSILQFCAQISG